MCFDAAAGQGTKDAVQQAMGIVACAFHRWFRFAFADEADVWKCRKCGALVERPAGAAAPPAAAKARA